MPKSSRYDTHAAADRAENIKYVLYIEWACDPPRVAVCDTFDEAEEYLDVFEVERFDPPQNEDLDRALLCARIFRCKGTDWGAEIDVRAAVNQRTQAIRENPHAPIPRLRWTPKRPTI